MVENKTVYCYEVEQLKFDQDGYRAYTRIGSVSIVGAMTRSGLKESDVDLFVQYLRGNINMTPSEVCAEYQNRGINLVYTKKIIESDIEYNIEEQGDDEWYFDVDGERWFLDSENDITTKELWRCCTRDLIPKTVYDEWSEYSDEIIESNNDIEVRTRVMYRWKYN